MVAGTVTEYDFERGLGTVTAADGRAYRFHCSAIADGTRRIDLDRAVVFDVGPAGLGQWEARTVVPLG